jgi:hypothetical protein
MKLKDTKTGNGLETVKQKSGLKQLRELALAESRKRYPSFPESARYVKPYSDKTANNLQRAIIDFLTLSGHQCERISVTGRYIDQSKIITDVLGNKRRVGSGKWIPGSMTKGSADLSAVIFGKAVKLEIKINSDKQSADQKKYQEQIEQAGGVYLIISSFSQFAEWYNNLK